MSVGTTDRDEDQDRSPDAPRKLRPTRKTLVVAGLAVVLVACAAVVSANRYNRPPVPPRADETGSTREGIGEVTAANNRFAFDLYSQLAKPDNGNLFFSPYSISTALAMTYEGAQGKTADEMRSVMHFPQRNVLGPNAAAIYNGLNEGGKDYELATGNALWVQQDFPLLPDYTTAVEKYYGGKATGLDFVGAPEESRQTINEYIAEQTRGKIEDLLPEGSLDALTGLVLTNAIYFKGTWRWEFDSSETRDEDFHLTPTETVTAPMMTMDPDERFNYADTADAQILELPYRGGDFSMLVLLPKQDLTSFAAGLDAEQLDKYRSVMRETDLSSISLPRFEFDAKYSMADTLASMGMPTAFSDSADFSGMTGDRPLWISGVIHQAYIKVDEKGTEAAAATAVDMSTGLPDTIAFRADRPFLFVIQEEDTGNILFLGRVVDPTT